MQWAVWKYATHGPPGRIVGRPEHAVRRRWIPREAFMRSRKRSLSIVAVVAMATAGIGIASSAGATTVPPSTEPAGTAAAGTEAVSRWCAVPVAGSGRELMS